MSVSALGRHASILIAATALLAGCGGSNSGIGSPFAAIPSASARGEAARSSEQVLYSFTGGNDGGDAAAGLAFDSQGNLYGTTVVGGGFTCGTVFALAPQATPPWKETVLHSFTCYGDGKNPYGGVAFDSHGNLDGTTVAGGSGGPCASDGCGVVYQLNIRHGRKETVLHSFTAGNDGFGPGGGVAFDASGDVFGTTPDGGAASEGVVYEVSRSARRWHERVVHTFTGGRDGAVGSLGPLLFDGASFFGVTEEGGAHGVGTAFKLSRSGRGWKFTAIYAFKGGSDAASPYGGLLMDGAGNLFGTTYYGGASGLGTVFELTPARGAYRERVLYSFKGGSDGSFSTSTLVFGGPGDLYGTTSMGGGSCDCGTIFKLNAKTGAEQVLHSFGGGGDGAYPYYGMTRGPNGDYYGATVAGGSFGQGAVYEFTP
jgi:uncharacterized repeat protein (TIGR03803 family)